MGAIKADLECDCLHPAQDPPKTVESSKRIVSPSCKPGRSAAAAGIAKRIKSAVEDAPPLKLLPKQSRTTKLPQPCQSEIAAARQPMQQSSNEAVEVNGVIHIDVSPQDQPDSACLQQAGRVGATGGASSAGERSWR